MSVYLKKFETASEYEAYIASEGKVLPNVSFCEDERDVHYNPYVGTPKVELKYYVSSDDLGNDIKIFHTEYAVPFETMEVDGVLLDDVVNSYRFETEGIHTVKLTLPEGETELEGFYECSNLIEVKIPNIITIIRDKAFNNCSDLTSVTIPNSVTSIGEWAFYNCSGLTSVTIPNSVTSIGCGAFYGTAWYGNQPDGLVYAGKVAYEYKGTMPTSTSITIKDGTLGIGGNAFYGCSGLTSVTIPNSVTSIGYSAFFGCSGLTAITIPNSVTSIGGSAFYWCTRLTSITIPNSVTNIGSNAFYGCSRLTSITINATTPPTVEELAFDDTNNCPIYVPSESVNAYKTATNWSEYADRIQAIP